MSAIPVIAGLYCVGLWLLFRQWRGGRGSAQFVLGVLPAALLFLTAPIPLAGWELIQGFQRIGENGLSGSAAAAPFCLAIARALRLGAGGFLVAMGVAGVLQVLATRAGGRSPQSSHGSDARGAAWGRRIVVASMLLVVPVGFLNNLTQGVPRLVMRVAVPSGLIGMGTIEQISTTVTNQSLLAVVVGGVLTAVVGMFAIANLLAARSGTALDSLARYSWVILASVCMWALLSVVQLTADINSFQLALR